MKLEVKMKTYLLRVSFEGMARVVIKADNEDEAKELLLSGEYDEKNYTDESESYEVNSIEDIS